MDLVEETALKSWTLSEERRLSFDFVKDSWEAVGEEVEKHDSWAH